MDHQKSTENKINELNKWLSTHDENDVNYTRNKVLRNSFVNQLIKTTEV